MIRVWDPLQRLIHWSLVLSVAIAWLTAEDSTTWHEGIGYVALGLIGLRLIWGFIGPRYARFTQFITGPKKAIAYTREVMQQREKRFIGHNPLGAAMVVALLVSIAATGVTGWLMADPKPMAGVKDAHEILATLMLGLIFLHVGGVIYASKRHKENLALAMITGNKPVPKPDDIT